MGASIYKLTGPNGDEVIYDVPEEYVQNFEMFKGFPGYSVTYLGIFGHLYERQSFQDRVNEAKRNPHIMWLGNFVNAISQTQS